jgi:hypothetical protein
MTGVELIERVRTRGGQLRVAGDRLQYRPAGVLDAAELAWLADHRAEVARALGVHDDQVDLALQGDALGGRRPLGEAGPGVPAWHCRIGLGSNHEPGTRPDGSVFCATCHPTTIAVSERRRLQ